MSPNNRLTFSRVVFAILAIFMSAGLRAADNGTHYASTEWIAASVLRTQRPYFEAAWRTLKVGAGGYLIGMDIVSDNTMVTRTDTYGAYLWKGSQWQQLITSSNMPTSFQIPGLNAGVYEIQIAPSNSNIFYMTYNGYVLKTTNKGSTWKQTSFSQVTETTPFNNYGLPQPYKQWGPKMAIDPGNANYVFVGTGQSGMFATKNGGTTWAAVSGIPAPANDGSIGCNGNACYPGYIIVWDPNENSYAYAQSYGNGIYATTDAMDGASSTWTKINNGGGPGAIFHAAISSSSVLYCVDTNQNLWKYSGGKTGTWTEILPSSWGANVVAVAIDPTNADHVIALGYNGAADGKLNESDDAGNSWGGWSTASLNGGNMGWQALLSPYVGSSAMFFDQTNSDKLYVSGGNDFWNTTYKPGINGSTAITWNSQGDGIEQLVANQIIVPSSNHPLVASWDRAVFAPTPGGGYPSTFYTGNSGVYAGWSIDIAPGTSDIDVLSDGGYANFGEASAYSTNGGLSFSTFAAPSNARAGGGGGTIAVSTSSNVVIAPGGGERPSYTTNFDASPTWTGIAISGISTWPNIGYFNNDRWIVADQVRPNAFYMFIDGKGVYESTNGGATWSLVFSDPSGTVFAAAGGNQIMQAVPGEAGNLFYSPGDPGYGGSYNWGFYQSINGGKNWTAVANVGLAAAFGFGAPASLGGYPTVYFAGWLTSPSSSSVTIGTPNCSPNYCIIIGTGFDFTTGLPVQVTSNAAEGHAPQINGTIVSYSSTTGALVISPGLILGSGSYHSWKANVYSIWESSNCSASGGCSNWTSIGPWPNDSMNTIRAITGDPGIYNRVYIGTAGAGYMQFN